MGVGATDFTHAMGSQPALFKAMREVASSESGWAVFANSSAGSAPSVVAIDVTPFEKVAYSLITHARDFLFSVSGNSIVVVTEAVTPIAIRLAFSLGPSSSSSSGLWGVAAGCPLCEASRSRLVISANTIDLAASLLLLNSSLPIFGGGAVVLGALVNSPQLFAPDWFDFTANTLQTRGFTGSVSVVKPHIGNGSVFSFSANLIERPEYVGTNESGVIPPVNALAVFGGPSITARGPPQQLAIGFNTSIFVERNTVRLWPVSGNQPSGNQHSAMDWLTLLPNIAADFNRSRLAYLRQHVAGGGPSTGSPRGPQRLQNALSLPNTDIVFDGHCNH